jgi:hypothetical protein
LIQDLNSAHYAGTLTDVNGVQYTGINSATVDKLTVEIPYGLVQIDWVKISPKTLLAISESFIQPNMPDAADRQWFCAVCAIQNGQTDVGRQLAKAPAKSKSEYRDELEFLLPAAPSH